MKKKIVYYFSIILLVFMFQIPTRANEAYLNKSQTHIQFAVGDVKYEAGNWKHPDYSKPFVSLGNHRFKIKIKKFKKFIKVVVPWRRRDIDPEKKDIAIVGSETERRVNNVIVLKIYNEKGEIVFEPFKTEKTYFIYYLPHKSTGGYYPKVKYISPVDRADPKWRAEYKKLDQKKKKKIPCAKIIAAQSIDSFHSFFPMEIIAGKEEVKDFLKKNPRKFYLFPEYRENPVRMFDHLPLHWIRRGIKSGIKDMVKRGEFYTFQIAIYSPDNDLSDLKVDFSGLSSDSGDEIKKTGLECFNISGVDLNGKFFKKHLNVIKEKVQPLWIGIDIPADIKPGIYRGKCVVSAKNLPADSINIELNILNKVIKNHGDNNPAKMSRLRWLNSRLGVDKDFIVKPFIPVSAAKKTINILGRKIKLGADGLPERIESFFTERMTSLKPEPEQVLSDPISLKVVRKGFKPEIWRYSPFRILQRNRSDADWSVSGKSKNFILNISGHVEYDGMMNYKIDLTAKKSVDISDIFLSIPMAAEAAKYMVGLGRKGGRRPGQFSWKWDINFHQEGVWLGDVNRGLQYVLRDENYERPLNTNFYHNKPLKLPYSWGNGGKGGVEIKNGKNNSVVIKNYSGPRRMEKGETLHFNVRFLITPFKLIDLKKHFKTRFVHKYLPINQVKELGGTVVNVHHATEINPYINYPFFNLKKQRDYINEAHKSGIKVKLYNTIRELTYRAYELFALKSLGDEIFNDGDGGGHSWLQEHLKSHYHSAWHATKVNDAAILDKGTSRWTNYYIEGLNWLAKNQKIDGLYLDDIAFSRETVKRIATVLNKQREDVIIDLHSANQFNKRDGFVNSVFLYMEHLPYISRLWFGEYFEYDMGPDYWLTEVSGIPFGLTGEMLEKGGHPYRGMVYGMTTRVYGQYNPGELWKLFDKFGIADSEMSGYWVKDSPVKTFVKDIRSTVYKNRNKLLIAIGSWSSKDENVKLNIDWSRTGFEKDNAILYAPEIEGLQQSEKFDLSVPVKVKKERGIILILKKKNRS